MRATRYSILSLLVLLLASGCQDSQQAAGPPPSSPPETPAKPEQEQVAIDTTRYIRATDLLERMENETGHYVFDVRSEKSYADSHIRDSLSMPFGKVEPQDVAQLDGMTLDTPIVTYCGCPHHLAGLGADQLIEWGYRNVRVLYEGYWYWKDNRFPVAGLQLQQTRELMFAGVVVSGDRPLASTDVFIRNTRNGQLEAAATDANGRFETAFHVLGYRPDDRFEVRVGSLEAPVARVLGGAQTGNITMPVVDIDESSFTSQGQG